ncbi:conserved hypothetical protein [Vibrio chagasii]|nr:conserved hypothetical protein [Vibrio chagasii]
MKQNELIVEKDLKMKLAYQCVHTVKTYAKEKEAKTKSRPLRKLLRNFIMNNEFDYSFAIHLSILFAYDYEIIKQKVINKEFSLKHISTEDYWETKGHSIDREESVFFLYTFFNELYPTAIDDINAIAERQSDGEDILAIIQDVVNSRNADDQ